MPTLLDVVAEQQRRSKRRGIVGDCHKSQQDVLEALATVDFLAVLMARRQGKTEGFLRYACDKGLDQPGYRVAWVEDYPQSAAETVRPLLDGLAVKYGFAYRYNSQTHTFTISGTRGDFIIRCYGVRHERFIAGVRGKFFDLIVIDEVQRLWDVDLASSINSVLLHTLADRRGKLALGATPGEVDCGLLYRIVDMHGTVEHGQELQVDGARRDAEMTLARMFTLVEGEPFSNPAVADQQRKQLEAYREHDPDIEQRPWVQREMFGRWVSDTSRSVVNIPDGNLLTEWAPHGDDVYVGGMDYGFNPDPCAFLVGVYNNEVARDLILLEAFEVQSAHDTELLEVARKLEHRYPGLELNVDCGGGGKAPMELFRSHGLNARPADKTEDHRVTTRRMVSDAALGQLKLYNVSNPGAPQEHPMLSYWRASRWVVTRKGLEVSKPKHLHDAARYLYRRARHHDYRPPAAEPTHKQRIISATRKRQSSYLS